jgi:hypothetical protein
MFLKWLALDLVRFLCFRLRFRGSKPTSQIRIDFEMWGTGLLAVQSVGDVPDRYFPPAYPSPPAFDSKIFFLKGFDSNLDTNQIRFWFWRFEWVENTARTPGLSLFLIHYFQYTKRTITHLLSISFWEVVWFQDWGRVLQR